MKIRNGFVSNSSSSSFVILGEQIDINDITIDELKNKNKNYHYIAKTGIYYDGQMIVVIDDKKMLDLLKRANNNEFDEYGRMENSIEVYKAYVTFDENDEFKKIKISDLPDEFEMYMFTVDQHSPDTADELEEMYKGEY